MGGSSYNLNLLEANVSTAALQRFSTLVRQIGDTLSKLYPRTIDFSSLYTEVLHSGHFIDFHKWIKGWSLP